jgi:hypothetical protein
MGGEWVEIVGNSFGVLSWFADQPDCFSENVRPEPFGRLFGGNERGVAHESAFEEIADHPIGFFGAWLIDAVSREDVKGRVFFDAPVAIVERASHSHPERFDGRSHELRLGNDFDDSFPVFRAGAEPAGLGERGDERQMLALRTLGEIPPDHENFLRVARRDFLAGGHAPSGAGQHGERIPGLPHALAIEVAGFEIGMDLRGRDDHEPDVPVRNNSVSAQPISEQEAMG